MLWQSTIERALAVHFHPRGEHPALVPRLKPFPYPAYTSNDFTQGLF